LVGVEFFLDVVDSLMGYFWLFDTDCMDLWLLLSHKIIYTIF